VPRELRKSLLVLLADRRSRRHRECERDLHGAKHPKSFVSAQRRGSSVEQAPRCGVCRRGIAAWSERYLDMVPEPDEMPIDACWSARRQRQVRAVGVAGSHRYLAAKPVSVAATAAAEPYEYLLAGLGACTSMTIRLYADLKKIPLTRVSVLLKHDKFTRRIVENARPRRQDRPHRPRIRLESDLSMTSAKG